MGYLLGQFKAEVNVSLTSPLVHQELNRAPASFQIKANRIPARITKSSPNTVHVYGARIIKNTGPWCHSDGGISINLHEGFVMRDHVTAGARKVQFCRVRNLIDRDWRLTVDIAKGRLSGIVRQLYVVYATHPHVLAAVNHLV